MCDPRSGRARNSFPTCETKLRTANGGPPPARSPHSTLASHGYLCTRALLVALFARTDRVDNKKKIILYHVKRHYRLAAFGCTFAGCPIPDRQQHQRVQHLSRKYILASTAVRQVRDTHFKRREVGLVGRVCQDTWQRGMSAALASQKAESGHVWPRLGYGGCNRQQRQA